MCIGVPMRIIEQHDGWAWCESGLTSGPPSGFGGGAQGERVDMRLVAPAAPGDWALVFLGTARELMDEAQALQVLDALRALDAARRGETVDHLFADLVDREPQLPPHLRPTADTAHASNRAMNQESPEP